MSGRIELNGVSLYVQSVGEGPTVVLLHGMPLDHRMWDETVRVLHRRYRVIRYDLRGAGRSGDGEGRFEHHDDLRALLEALEVDRASIVGISVGGKIAIDYALRYPDTVRSLVLINPGVSGYRWSDAFLANERKSSGFVKKDGWNKRWNGFYKLGWKVPFASSRKWFLQFDDTCDKPYWITGNAKAKGCRISHPLSTACPK